MHIFMIDDHTILFGLSIDSTGAICTCHIISLIFAYLCRSNIAPVANVICYYTTSTINKYFLSYLIFFIGMMHIYLFVFISWLTVNDIIHDISCVLLQHVFFLIS